MISDDARKRGGELLPVLRYPGSKARLASWIVAHFPPHQVYCEPFAGSLAVLFAKPRGKTEIVNDLDSRITNLFQVIRDRPGELADAIEPQAPSAGGCRGWRNEHA